MRILYRMPRISSRLRFAMTANHGALPQKPLEDRLPLSLGDGPEVG
jgi:hypothetical protein